MLCYNQWKYEFVRMNIKATNHFFHIKKAWVLYKIILFFKTSFLSLYPCWQVKRQILSSWLKAYASPWLPGSWRMKPWIIHNYRNFLHAFSFDPWFTICQLRTSLLYNGGMSLHRSGRYWSINHIFTIPKLFHALICIELLQEKLLMGRNTIRFYLIWLNQTSTQW